MGMFVPITKIGKFQDYVFVYSENENFPLSVTNLIQFFCDGFESVPIGRKINNIHTLSDPGGGAVDM